MVPPRWVRSRVPGVGSGSGSSGPDAARRDQPRDAQVEVGRAGRGVLGEHPRGGLPLLRRAVRVAEHEVRSAARSSRIPPWPKKRRSLRASSSGGAAAATRSAASARSSCTRPSSGGSVARTSGRSSARTPVEQQPAAGRGHLHAVGLDDGDRPVLDHLDAERVREVGAHAQVRRRRRTGRRRRAARPRRRAACSCPRPPPRARRRPARPRTSRCRSPRPARRRRSSSRGTRASRAAARSRRAPRPRARAMGSAGPCTGGSPPRQRPPWRGQATSARPSASTSPAPSVSTRSPSRSRGRR